MIFSAPILLYLLPLAGLPIIFHLILKQKKRMMVFSTLMFFHQVDPKLNTRRQIREWLLLLLRVLTIALVLLALLVPLARFGPRYLRLAIGDRDWADTAMDRDSHAAARLVLERAHPGDTLFVWGYRPDIFAYTRMPAGARFLESQPLTGVFADRHLVQSGAVFAAWAGRNRQELARTRPTFVLDGLSPYNPALSIAAYPDLAEWFSRYQPEGRTEFTLIYRLRRK